MRNPTPRVNLLIRGHFVVILKPVQYLCNHLSHHSSDLWPSTQEDERGHVALAIDEKEFDPKAFKLLIKAGYDSKEKLSLGKLPPEANRQETPQTQRYSKLLEWVTKSQLDWLFSIRQSLSNIIRLMNTSRAYEDCILDMASGGCVMRHGHHKPYLVHSEYVARTVDSKRGSVLCHYMTGSSPMHLEMHEISTFFGGGVSFLEGSQDRGLVVDGSRNENKEETMLVARTRKTTKRVNINYVSEGFSSTEDHKREENLIESVFNRLGPNRKELLGIANRQSIFDRSDPYGEVEEEDAKDALAELEEGIKTTIDELKEVNIYDIENPRPIYISASLTQEEEGTYIALLHEFKDVFAWSYKEIPGLDPKVVVHHLSIKKGACPVKQGQHRFRPELISLIEGEVNKIIEVNFIREVKYPMWISNIVPIRKKNGQIRVCVDFRDLNNACPKDDFPLPIVELMIDTTTGDEALSFMDGSFGYNQIRMAPTDEELMAFRTPKGIYCYKVMPFGLKNAGATYQRAMQKIFDDMLHKNVECYVDDLVVKSKKLENHFRNLRKVFEGLRRYQLKMNPSKCAFGVTSGKFLGFFIRQRGIEIEQAKIDSILRMLEPRNIHELKSLQGKLAYL
ncbi:UNVERIFIED_CONTAM: Transposon Tf2-12 polyprotein [Sesamum calycinum]|uniref:Transposon Tf2-12 polyprotein n=1 Tax=Sesamum calycinum TaxID=2727403 RepID=A0AAW2L748_9LAMI